MVALTPAALFSLPTPVPLETSVPAAPSVLEASLLPSLSAVPREPFSRTLPSLAGLSAAGEERPPSVDRTEDFLRFYDGAGGGRSPVSAEARGHRVLIAPGFMWDWCPGAYVPNLEEFRALGIDARLIKVPSMGRSARRAAMLAEEIERSPIPVVILGHSMGGIDAWRVYVRRPDLRPKIKAIAAVGSPFDGAALAKAFEELPNVRVAIQAAARVARHAWRELPNLLEDTAKDLMGREIRGAPPEAGTRLISIVSSIAHQGRRALFPLRWTRWLTKRLSGKDSDGLVSPEDAVMPGSEVIHLPGMSHADPVLDHPFFVARPAYDARTFTRALAAYLFPPAP